MAGQGGRASALTLGRSRARGAYNAYLGDIGALFDEWAFEDVAGTVKRFKIWDGSTWVACTTKVWNGSIWVTSNPKPWNGSIWA
jgi:hypothetical protein